MNLPTQNWALSVKPFRRLLDTNRHTERLTSTNRQTNRQAKYIYIDTLKCLKFVFTGSNKKIKLFDIFTNLEFIPIKLVTNQGGA